MCLWKYNAWTPFWHELHTVLLLLQGLFFWSEHTTHSLFFLPSHCVSLVAEVGWTGSPTIALNSEAKESITSFMNSNLEFGFLTVSLCKIQEFINNRDKRLKTTFLTKVLICDHMWRNTSLGQVNLHPPYFDCTYLLFLELLCQPFSYVEHQMPYKKLYLIFLQQFICLVPLVVVSKSTSKCSFSSSITLD